MNLLGVLGKPIFEIISLQYFLRQKHFYAKKSDHSTPKFVANNSGFPIGLGDYSTHAFFSTNRIN